jgi:hypothetical protein
MNADIVAMSLADPLPGKAAVNLCKHRYRRQSIVGENQTSAATNRHFVGQNR